MTTTLIALAFLSLGLAAAADLAFGVRSARVRRMPYFLAAGASIVLVWAGLRAMFVAPSVVSLDSILGFPRSSLVVDPLAGLFLVITSGVALMVSLGFISWVRPGPRVGGRGLAAAYSLLLAAVATVIMAGDAFLFLFAWEILTLSFYALVAIDRHHEDRSAAAHLTLGMGRSGGAFLLVGFLLLATRVGSYVLFTWHSVPAGTVQSVAYLLIFVGFAAKVGLIPFQGWMPAAYSAAPGPARAAMAAVAMNVGVYGFWRFLGLLGRPPEWLAILALVLGGTTALLGVAHATVQSDLMRVVAYSSVENGGIIVAGFGIALAGASIGSPGLEAVGLLAASLQAVAHAIAKCALFLSAGNFEAECGSTALEDLRGSGRRRPFSGGAFAAGALTLAGLPPTIGFVSAWFILEALMQQFRLPGLALKIPMALAGALLALTAGFAALAFVRLLGVVVLGEDRNRGMRGPGWAGAVALTLLGVGCFAIAAVTPLEIRFLARGLGPVVPAAVMLRALKSPFVLQPVFADFSILSPSWLWAAMPILFAVTVGLSWLLSRGGIFKVRRVSPWLSASGEIAGEDSYSAFGYANPARHVLAAVLRTQRGVESIDSSQGDSSLEYRSDVVEPVEKYVFQPVVQGTLWLSRQAKRLQSGRLAAYVAYMLIALVAALAATSLFR